MLKFSFVIQDQGGDSELVIILLLTSKRDDIPIGVQVNEGDSGVASTLTIGVQGKQNLLMLLK